MCGTALQCCGTVWLRSVVWLRQCGGHRPAFIVPISATVCTPYKYDCRERKEKCLATQATQIQICILNFTSTTISHFHYFLEVCVLADQKLLLKSFLRSRFRCSGRALPAKRCKTFKNISPPRPKCLRKATGPPPISPNPLISPAPGTQTVIATIGFHFLCNWTRNGAGDKKGTFSNTCYLVFQQRRARQRLWFVQFAKFAKHCLPPKSCEPANAILPFPFRPPAAASQPPHIHIYLNLFVSFGLQLSFPGSQKFRSKWRNPISVITWFVICGVLLLREPFTGNGCEKISNSCSFGLLVGNLAKTTHWIPINGCQQSEPDAGGCWSTLFSQGRGWGVGEVGAKTGLHRLTSCSIHAQHPQDWLDEQWGGRGLSVCCSTEAIWILGRWAVASWLTWPWSVGLVW